MHVGTVAFPRMDDEDRGFARRRQHLAAGLDRGFEQSDVVAERLAEAARLQEIALHIDDNERGAGKIDADVLGSAVIWVIMMSLSVRRARCKRAFAQRSAL